MTSWNSEKTTQARWVQLGQVPLGSRKLGTERSCGGHGGFSLSRERPGQVRREKKLRNYRRIHVWTTPRRSLALRGKTEE